MYNLLIEDWSDIIGPSAESLVKRLKVLENTVSYAGLVGLWKEIFQASKLEK